MKKTQKIQLGSMTVLVVALMQAGLVYAGNTTGPAIYIDTSAIPNFTGCSNSSSNQANGSGCTVTSSGKTIELTTPNSLVTYNSPVIVVNGDTSGIDVINFSGTVNAQGGEDGVALNSTGASKVAFNLVSGSINGGVGLTTRSSDGTDAPGLSGQYNAGVAGGAGGVGGASAAAGVGGNGGAGVSGTNFLLNNQVSITGGNGGVSRGGIGGGAQGGNGGYGYSSGGAGGAGGTGGAGGPGGLGGRGGAGVSGTNFSLNNEGSITGGNGGLSLGGDGGDASGGSGGGSYNPSSGAGAIGGTGGVGGAGGTGGVGGAGISGSGFSVTNTSTGTITGGTGGNSNGGRGGGADGGGGGDVNGYAGGVGGKGGFGGAGGAGGVGGAGGAGVSGSSFTLINRGVITGGNGGTSGGDSGGGADGGADGGAGGVNGTAGANGSAGVAGAGGIGVVSTGNATIINSNTISGGLNPISGIRADAINLSGAGNTLDLQGGSTINGNVISNAVTTVSGYTEIYGNFSNSGSVAITASGDAEISGSFLNSGSVAVAANTRLYVADDYVNGVNAVTTVSGYAEISGNFSNSGSVAIAKDAELYVGSNYVNGVNAVTTVSGYAQINGNFSNSGSVSIAADAGLNVYGNFINTGGTFTSVVTDTNYGKLSVTGIATLSGSKLFVDASTLTTGHSYTQTTVNGVTTATLNGVIQAGSIVGTFASYSDNSALFDFTPVYTGTDVNLTFAAASKSGVLDAVTTAGNTAGQGAASALDQIIVSNPTSAISLIFAGVGTGQVSNAVSQTLPQIAGVVSQSVTTNLGSITRIVQSRQDGQQGRSSGDNFYGDKKFWFKPFGSWANQDSQNGVAGYKSRSYGMIFGADADLSDVNRVGVAFAYSKTDIDSKGVAVQNANVDSYTALVYGTHNLTASTELSAQAGLGLNNTSGGRTINIGATNSRASSSYDSWSANVGVGLAHTMALSEKTNFIPSIRVDYSRIRSDAYSETGAGALNLNVGKNTSDALVLGADGKVSHAISSKATLVANLGVGYDFINDRSSLTSSFAGAPTITFATQGIDPSPWLVRGGFGVVGKVTQTMEVTARYDFEARRNFDNQTASIKARWMF